MPIAHTETVAEFLLTNQTEEDREEATVEISRWWGGEQ